MVQISLLLKEEECISAEKVSIMSKLLYTHFIISAPFASIMLTFPQILWIALMVELVLQQIVSQHLDSFNGRSMMFMLMAWSSSVQDPLHVIFTWLISCFYILSFPHLSAAPNYIQISIYVVFCIH